MIANLTLCVGLTLWAVLLSMLCWTDRIQKNSLFSARILVSPTLSRSFFRFRPFQMDSGYFCDFVFLSKLKFHTPFSVDDIFQPYLFIHNVYFSLASFAMMTTTTTMMIYGYKPFLYFKSQFISMCHT